MRAARSRTVARTAARAEAVRRKPPGAAVVRQADASAVPVAAALPVPGVPLAARVASVQGLQRTIGNQAVQPLVQRWKDDGHIQTTRAAANAVFPDVASFFTTIGMSRDDFIKELGEASVNMDKILPHLGDRFAPGFGETKFYSFVGTLIKSGVGDMLPGNQRKGQTRRGMKGEGPDHGEAGYYDVPRAAAVAGNVARTEKYVTEAVAAFKQKQYKLMIARLGDACHVAADRGSHAEGGQGEGHDTRMPDPDKGEHGTNLQANPPYMENWADNDIMSLNQAGYAWGLTCTMGVLRDFFDRVKPDLMEPTGVRSTFSHHDDL
jgi:hypothetical protein